MKINIKPSFARIYKKLPHSEKSLIDAKIAAQKDLIELIIYGNHDEIRRFLRQV